MLTTWRHLRGGAQGSHGAPRGEPSRLGLGPGSLGSAADLVICTGQPRTGPLEHSARSESLGCRRRSRSPCDSVGLISGGRYLPAMAAAIAGDCRRLGSRLAARHGARPGRIAEPSGRGHCIPAGARMSVRTVSSAGSGPPRPFCGAPWPEALLWRPPSVGGRPLPPPGSLTASEVHGPGLSGFSAWQNAGCEPV